MVNNPTGDRFRHANRCPRLFNRREKEALKCASAPLAAPAAIDTLGGTGHGAC